MSNLILSQGNNVEFATWDGVKSRSFIEKERYYGYDKECEIWCNYGTFQHWLPDGRTAIIVANNGMVHEIPAQRIRMTLHGKDYNR